MVKVIVLHKLRCKGRFLAKPMVILFPSSQCLGVILPDRGESLVRKRVSKNRDQAHEVCVLRDRFFALCVLDQMGMNTPCTMCTEMIYLQFLSQMMDME
jgi:hypothetical protein